VKRMTTENKGENVEKQKSKYAIDMCNGPVLGKMLMFAVPLIFSSVLQLLFNAADVMVVGRFAGDNALAAVGATSSLIHLLTNLFIGFSVGTNVLVARYHATEEEGHVRESVHTSILLSIIGGLILTVVGVVFAPAFLRMMDTPEEVIDLASLYLRLYFTGMTASMLYNFGSAVLRAIGDTKRPLYYLFFAGVVNLLLNLIFVIVFDMSVAGVALATVVSQYISAFLIIRCLLREESDINLCLKELRFYKDKLIEIVRIGLPAGFQSSLFSLSNVVIQSAVNGFGAVAVAGNSIASNIESFVYASMNAFYQAAISFVGQNYGVGKIRRIGRVMIVAVICVTSVGLVLGNVFYLFGRPLLGLYSSSPDVIDAGMVRLRFICSVYFACGIMDVMVGVMRGLGHSVVPMIVSLIGACGFRLLWIATIFQIEQFHSIETVYVSYFISWVLTAAAHTVCYIIIRKRMNRVDNREL